MNTLTTYSSWFTKIFGIIMILLYAGIGLSLLLFPEFVANISGYPRYALGILLLCYAGFRVYRLLKSKKQTGDEE